MSFKFVFKGLARDSLRYNVFPESKKDCVTVSNTVVFYLCWNKITVRHTTSNVFECVNNIWRKTVKVLH